jgi:hypothetical protein
MTRYLVRAIGAIAFIRPPGYQRHSVRAVSGVPKCKPLGISVQQR